MPSTATPAAIAPTEATSRGPTASPRKTEPAASRNTSEIDRAGCTTVSGARPSATICRIQPNRSIPIPASQRRLVTSSRRRASLRYFAGATRRASEAWSETPAL